MAFVPALLSSCVPSSPPPPTFRLSQPTTNNQYSIKPVDMKMIMEEYGGEMPSPEVLSARMMADAKGGGGGAGAKGKKEKLSKKEKRAAAKQKKKAREKVADEIRSWEPATG